MAWFKFLNPRPEDSKYTPSRFYVESDSEEEVLSNPGKFGVIKDWFGSEVDASEVPDPESTCPLEEKFKEEGFPDCYVRPLGGYTYTTHYWSDYGFVVAGHGFAYDADENTVSDVHASDSEGREFSGPRIFEFISPEFDPSIYADEYNEITVGELDGGIKFQKNVFRSETEEFPPLVHYMFWSEDRETIIEYQEKLSLISDEIKDLEEARNEMLEGFC